MGRTTFGRMARAIISATLAWLAAGTTSGCGAGGVDTAGMSLPPCDGETQAFALLENISLPETYDSLDFAVVFQNGEPPQITASVGTRCETAKDLVACDAALRDIFAPEDPIPVTGFQMGSCIDYCDVRILVATRGDEVVLIQDADAARALFGPIDTPTEVVWAVSLAEYQLGCDEEQFGIRETADGYEAAATRSTSDCETTQYLLAVGADASVSVLDEAALASEDPDCG